MPAIVSLQKGRSNQSDLKRAKGEGGRGACRLAEQSDGLVALLAGVASFSLFFFFFQAQQDTHALNKKFDLRRRRSIAHLQKRREAQILALTVSHEDIEQQRWDVAVRGSVGVAY